MDRFAKAHPALQLIFFGCVFVLSLAAYNPFFSAVSLIGALAYDASVRGRRALSGVKAMLTIIALVSIFNMIFSHYGMHVLFKIGYVDFTLEALFYGFNQGIVLCAVFLWFSVLSRVVDSERVAYALRLSPRLALIFSMVLSFIPRFSRKLEDIRMAKLGLNSGKPPESLRDRLRDAIDTLSGLISYSLEASIVTSESMLARGYTPTVINSRRYRISALDIVLLLLCAAVLIYVLYAQLTHRIAFVFEPEIRVLSLDYIALSAFAILCLMPFIVRRFSLGNHKM